MNFMPGSDAPEKGAPTSVTRKSDKTMISLAIKSLLERDYIPVDSAIQEKQNGNCSNWRVTEKI